MISPERVFHDVHKEDVRDFVDTLNSKAHIRLLKRKYDQMNIVDFRERPAAAGSGSEWDNYTENEPVVLYDNSAVALADEIFIVNGESMEPQFSDGDRVLVQYTFSSDSLPLTCPDCGNKDVREATVEEQDWYQHLPRRDYLTM